MTSVVQTHQDLDRYRADALYFEAHRDELLRRYPDRWVAVFNREVVGAAKHIPTLIAQLERKGIASGDVFREYLTERDELLIL